MTEEGLVKFDGAAYAPALDQKRLSSKIHKVFRLMADYRWRTLQEISESVIVPEASASAYLRDFRKKRWGYMVVDRRRRGDPKDGLFEYRLSAPLKGELVQDELFKGESNEAHNISK